MKSCNGGQGKTVYSPLNVVCRKKKKERAKIKCKGEVTRTREEKKARKK